MIIIKNVKIQSRSWLSFLLSLWYVLTVINPAVIKHGNLELQPIVVAHQKGCGAAAVKEGIPLKSRHCDDSHVYFHEWPG